MNSYQEVLKSICRVCLSHSSYENMVSLFDTTSEDGLSCYGKFVVTFANIKLASDNNLPGMMCNNCISLLKQAIMFKHTCENSDLQLKNLIKMNAKKYYNHKEIICQYTIFKHYFPEECVPTTTNISKVNGGMPFSSMEKSDETCLQQNKVESKMSLLEDNDDSFNSYWGHNSLNNIPVTQDTNMESKLFKSSNNSDDAQINKSLIDSDDALLNVIEKVISTNHKMDMTVYNYRYKNFTNPTKQIKKKFKCNVCHLQLSSKLSHKRHMQRHNGRKFICEDCAKSYHTKSELTLHQVAIHGIGPYLQCNHCEFKTASKVALIEHIRLHTGERPFVCEQCGLTFRRRAIYRKHLIYHDKKNVQCPQCPMKFYRNYDMLEHMNNIHERMYLYACNKCGVTYTQSRTVRRHMSEKHGIPREMQGKIGKVRKGSDTGFPTK